MEPDRFNQLVLQVFDPASMHPVVRAAIDVTSDESGQVQQLESVLIHYPQWRERLIMLPFLTEKVKAWAAEVNEKEPNFGHPIVLTRTLRILGKKPARDALAGLWLKQVGGGEANEAPTYALKAEEWVQDKNWPYASDAFSAGLHYDWLRALLNGKKAPPDSKAGVDDAWKSALQVASVAHMLGALVKNFKLSRFAFGAGVLIPWGGALMAYVFPKANTRTWAGFNAELDKLGSWRWAYQAIREPERFDVTSAEMRALTANYCGPFRDVDPALRYVETPYYLKEVSPDQYKLAQVLRLAQLTEGKKMEQIKFGPLEAQGLKDLGITPKQLWDAVGSIK